MYRPAEGLFRPAEWGCRPAEWACRGAPGQWEWRLVAQALLWVRAFHSQRPGSTESPPGQSLFGGEPFFHPFRPLVARGRALQGAARKVAGTNTPIQHPETTSLLQGTRLGRRAFSEVVIIASERALRLSGEGLCRRRPGAAPAGVAGGEQVATLAGEAADGASVRFPEERWADKGLATHCLN